MKIWQVWDGDYDNQWVVATYDSEALAVDTSGEVQQGTTVTTKHRTRRAP